MNNFLVTFPKICIYFILYILISESQYLDDLSIEDYVCPDVSIRLGDYLPVYNLALGDYHSGAVLRSVRKFQCSSRSLQLKSQSYLYLAQVFCQKNLFSAARISMLRSMKESIGLDGFVILYFIYSQITSSIYSEFIREYIIFYLSNTRSSLNKEDFSKLLKNIEQHINLDEYSLAFGPHNSLLAQNITYIHQKYQHRIHHLSQAARSIADGIDIKDIHTPFELYLSTQYKFDISIPGSRIINFEYYLLTLLQSEVKCSLSDESCNDQEMMNCKSLTHRKHLNDQKWPYDKPIKIFNDFTKGDPVFIESAKGLSDCLFLLGIPNKIVSYIHPNDESVYVILFPSVGITIPRNYIAWNFEKNPRVGDQPGFYKNTLGYESVTILPKSYFMDSLELWDVSTTHIENLMNDLNIENATLPLGIYHIPPLIPDENILETCTELSFVDADDSSIDELMPIDILFYGNSNDHRYHVFETFMELSTQYNVKFEFYTNAFSLDRDALLDQAKIVLNLGNWPLDGYKNELKGNTLNEHRIRYYLSKGKVVVSERTGIPNEETQYGGIVTFSDTKSLFWVCLRLLRDPLLRRKIEKRSIDFIAHQQRSFSKPSALSKLSTAMVNLRNYLYGKEYEQPAVSKPIESTPDYDSANKALKWVEETYANLYANKYGFNSSQEEASFYLSKEAYQRRQIHESLFASAYTARSRDFTSCLRSSVPNLNAYVDRIFVIGYLVRRYGYTGNYLEIGCSSADNLLYAKDYFVKKACVDPNSPQASVRLTSDDYFNHMDQMDSTTSTSSTTTTHADHIKFDLILINGLHEASQAMKDLKNSLRYLSEGGIILISNLRPTNDFEAEATNPYQGSAEHWLGDTWKVIPEIRAMSGVDLALLDLDWGLGVVKARTNPKPQTMLTGNSSTYKSLMCNLDRIVPFLSFNEFHSWLSSPEATASYVLN